MDGRILRAAAMIAAALAVADVFAADGPAGQAASRDRHMGVATCAGSACHGAAKLSGGAVRRDEYLLWQRDDHHARAYATLRSERSRRIAANLGLGAAHEARECLACHADFVPATERGDRFQLSDGVACEACHGAAERWLAPHVRGYADRSARLAGGLYPTWEPKARAELCLSCHQGDARRPMTHAIMGAGHPPLLFELDTFGALQPAHFEADADYTSRKGAPDGARNWAVGQAVAARLLLEGVGGAALGAGLFPELAWFECNACHHPMEPPRWSPGQGGPLPPGRPHLADAALHFTALWLDVAAPPLARAWREDVAQLHAATLGDAAGVRERAAAARRRLEAEILPLAQRHEPTVAELRRLALRVAEEGAGPRAGDFAIAEQTAMATAVLVTALGQAAGGKASPALTRAVNEVYDAVRNRERYDPARMRAALARLREQIAKAYPGAR